MNNLEILGLAYDLGASQGGASGGPAALRALELVRRIERLGCVVHQGLDFRSALYPPPASSPTTQIKHLELALPYLETIYQEVGKLYARGHFPLILGGDHSASISTVGSAVAALRTRKGADARLGLLWVDAHPDVNTPETSPSMNLHGMPLATLLGFGDPRLTKLGGFGPKLQIEDVALVGVRDVDPGEREFLRSKGVLAFSMKEIDQLGMGTVMERALAQITKHTAGVFVSYDLDVSDPNLAPGVGSPVRGGITFRESHLVMELVAECETLCGIEVVELNPALDHNNSTAELAVSLLESALGKSIL